MRDAQQDARRDVAATFAALEHQDRGEAEPEGVDEDRPHEGLEQNRPAGSEEEDDRGGRQPEEVAEPPGRERVETAGAEPQAGDLKEPVGEVVGAERLE